MKKWLAMLLVMCMAFTGAACAQKKDSVVEIVLSDDGVTVNGAPASTRAKDAVYVANDIVFYLADQDFTYGEGEDWEAHTQEEADAHTVVHITKPGTYVLSGKMSAGQVAVDVDDAKKDPDAVVTLVLNGVDITCSVAPAVIFYNVYECSKKAEDKATMTVDTSAAGANVIIADGTVNNVTGSHVARIYEPGTVELNKKGTKVEDAEKLHKYDAAFYSKRTMNVNGGPEGTGVLNIYADNEGLDTELHLTVNGGNINIYSGNDGINTNEDNVSVTTVNGGSLNIAVHGSTGEGDGIDSNGWLVFNGGNITVAGCGFSMDAGIDSDKGIWINGGNICATGNMFDHIEGGERPYAVFSFADTVKGGSVIILKNEAGENVAQWTPVNDFTYLVVSGDAVAPGQYTLWQDDVQLAYTGTTVRAFGGGGMNFGGMPGGNRPLEGFERPEGFGGQMPPEGFGGQMPPEGFDPSQMPQFGQMPPEGMPQGGPGGRGGFNPFGQSEGGEQQTIFIITEEGGSYSGVGAVK